jgi:hypothetical protein
VIRTAQAVIFDAAKKQRRQTMRTVGPDEADLPSAAAEKHQIFAQKFHSARHSTALLQERNGQDWNPVLSEKITDERAAIGRRQLPIFFRCERRLLGTDKFCHHSISFREKTSGHEWIARIGRKTRAGPTIPDLEN